jgi:hypothetical protein
MNAHLKLIVWNRAVRRYGKYIKCEQIGSFHAQALKLLRFCPLSKIVKHVGLKPKNNRVAFHDTPDTNEARDLKKRLSSVDFPAAACYKVTSWLSHKLPPPPPLECMRSWRI